MVSIFRLVSGKAMHLATFPKEYRLSAHAHDTHTLNNKTNRHVHFTIYQVKIPMYCLNRSFTN